MHNKATPMQRFSALQNDIDLICLGKKKLLGVALATCLRENGCRLESLFPIQLIHLTLPIILKLS